VNKTRLGPAPCLISREVMALSLGKNIAPAMMLAAKKRQNSSTKTLLLASACEVGRYPSPKAIATKIIPMSALNSKLLFICVLFENLKS